MNIITLCNTLKILNEPLCSEVVNDDLKLLFNQSICNLTKDNDISSIIQSFNNGVNINLKLYNFAFDIGVIFGILESNDQILLNLVDKIYWMDDDHPVELKFVRYLKDDLKSANDELRKYYTKINTKYEMLSKIESFEKQTESLYRRNDYLIIADKDFNYCKVSGYIALISAICNDFIRKYKDLDFAEVNAVNMQNVCFLIGISIGIMKEKNIEDRILLQRLNYIFTQIRLF